MIRKKKRPPTDLQILRTIYERYEHDFIHSRPDREKVIMVPIDIEAIAKTLRVDPHMLFGRLYYDLDRKHGYVQSTKGDTVTRVTLFAPLAGQTKDCVNFPLLAGVVAGLQDQHRQQRRAMTFSIVALVVSVGTLLLRLVGVP